MPMSQIMQLFQRLDAPEMAEMDGAYRAVITDQGSWIANLQARINPSNPLFPGTWLGKAVTPGDCVTGEGYNYFRPFTLSGPTGVWVGPDPGRR